MNIQYPLHFLDDTEYENLVVDICRDILGIGVVQFSIGRDGGRDGRFTGTANKFPSITDPWKGKFIIQAKHTTKVIASCSDSDFKNGNSGVLDGEIPRIQNLLSQRDIDCYLIFTNRAVSGNKDKELCDYIKEKTGLENCYLQGYETTNSHLLDHPELVKKYQLDILSGPLRFYDEDLKDIVLLLGENIRSLTKEEMDQLVSDLDFLSKKEKNEKNNLSEAYFNNLINKDLVYFDQISNFLTNPQNKHIAEMYENTVVELNNKITAKREEYDKFEEILNYLYDFMLEKHKSSLKSKRKLIYTLLNFMYYNCDLGQK